MYTIINNKQVLYAIIKNKVGGAAVENVAAAVENDVVKTKQNFWLMLFTSTIRSFRTSILTSNFRAFKVFRVKFKVKEQRIS